MGWQRGIDATEPNKENAAKLTWTGKIIHLGEGFYVMISQPPRKQCRLKPFPGLKKGGTIDV